MLAVPGAVVDAAASAAGRQVAAHYGNPGREQRALETGRGVVELPSVVVAVSGRDRLGWLDTLSSQRTRDLAPGDSAEILLLDVHGRIEHAAAVVDDGERTYLVTEADRAAGLAAFLDSMRFMLDVSVAVREDVVVLGVVPGGGPLTGPFADLAADADVLGLWRDPWPGVVEGGTRYALVGRDDAAHPGRELPVALALVAGDALDRVVAALGAAGVRPAGTLAWEALRVASWRPRLAREVDDRSLPHELDWLRTAVHLHKGCYKGQEGVARTFNLGRPPRRLAFLHLDGSDHLLPEPGAAVEHGGRVVGSITSVARHHELGPIALAILKRSTPVDATLDVTGPAGPIAASQEVIVAPDGHGDGRPEARGPVTPGLRRR
ncbi:hypothetical protein EDD28_1867 [Salana multivorans]|uniref:Aminomethyltransferase folate-binding domain-containing protein n=1 Tax=Salana multivorans TaxID=120377 RepID=A0A3N2DBV4_9MICO|nr:glycine cleavage T C-terminal barrel domain-containing protein [Salana multivorans]OJX97694.1 MAG: folate-binding protein YgfZ [Micrococcales bacterium 73-15]ROR97270.1 hypothetical protein EDD28_1867 [Salana multivorans]